jgi:putative ABC transport system permease protein
VVEFLNFHSDEIILGKQSLAGSVQDNGFTVQNRDFDFLLDLDGNVIQVAPGEMYVPITYLKDGLVTIGDTVGVIDLEFVVAGALRDSMMNSLLSSSKRFLVHAEDFDRLKGSGNIEYLIEFRLKDPSDLRAFGNEYTASGLEANGPTITYPLFKMLNGLSDGLMIAVILLISGLVVAVAFLCIRFTLLAKIEDDYREIGVMKAIGMRTSDIKKLYALTYAAIAGVGCLVGFGLSYAFRAMLLENIRLFMGASEHAGLSSSIAAASVVLVFLLIVAFVDRVLRRFKKIPAVEAIRFGIPQEQSTGKRHFRLSGARGWGANVFLGIKDVLTRKKLYATMLAVLVVAVFIIIVPQNLHHTVSSNDFISHMGIGLSDFRIDVQQTDSFAEKSAEIDQFMDKDEDIANHVVLTTRAYELKLDDGSLERLKIELGDHSVFPLSYHTGKAPMREDEIALSMLQASEIGRKVGDRITLTIGGQERNLTVCGLYSDVTNGGKTAKAAFSDTSAAIMWSVVSASLTDPTKLEATVAEYADRFGYAKVSDIHGYMAQTYGSTITALGTASYVATATALAIIALISLLFMRLLIAKDRYTIAVIKVLGFTKSDIRVQYLSRSVSILVIGITLGTVLSNTVGQSLVGMVMANFGGASFSFIIDPLQAYVLSPLAMMATVITVTILATWQAGAIDISENIKE